ncbi:MAG: 16S rRNA processing protein RimM [Chloroflexi bacterium]|nr:MAG: 16S rRNA processing protein RimM [Chloroflexota bacterium]
MMPANHSTPEKTTKTGSPQTGEPVYLAIGKLQRTHGVKGEILMDILTDFPERIKKGNYVYIGAHYREYIISTIRPANKKYLMSFEGLEDCDQAAILRNQMVFIKTKNANVLPEDKFYHHEIIGMTVYDESGNSLGTVNEILVTGANDVYVISPQEGEEILVPAIKTVVLSIDREKRKMIVRLPEWD